MTAGPSSPDRLFPIMKDGKYGFIDAAGRVRVKPRFEGVSTFSEGLARFRVGDKWGFIDGAGDVAIAPRFDSCQAFSEGFAAVAVRGRQGFIDRSGKFSIGPVFYRCESFQEGLAKVRQTISLKSVFIDSRGSIVLDRHQYVLSEVCEGLINCADDNRWGYINKEGLFVIPPQYTHARPFSEGLAAVCPGHEDEFVFIDAQGRVVIDARVRGAAIRFAEGLCAVWSPRGHGYIDRTGRLVIPHAFYYAGHFAEGMAVVRPRESGAYGFIDRTGAPVISPTFGDADPFVGGLASVAIGETFEQRRYGYIDKTGAYVWEPTR